MRTVFIFMIVALLTGCGATPYQRMGWRGGYEDAHIKDNIYYVNVQTNAYTSQVTAAQYFNRRAKEVCLENGYQDYQIFKERDTSGAFATYGGGHYGGTGAVVQKPGFGGYVECLRPKK